MTILARIAAQIFNTPLLVAPDAASALVFGLGSRLDVDASDFEASRFVGEPRGPRAADGSMRPMYRVEDGVALVSIMGELVNRGAWIGASSGLTSYEGIDAQLDAASADPMVRAIVLDMNSPGGQASGAMETAAKVRRITGSKPVVAFVNGLAASAAYAIASGASKIVVTPSAQVGSIGVVWLHLDRSEAIARAGVKPTLLTAGAYKADGHGMAALPDDARARIQGQIDDIYGLFVATVAAHRPMTEDAVRATEAGIFMGQSAVDAGLADQVGTLADVFARLARGASTSGNSFARTAIGANSMTDVNDTISRAAHDAAIAGATSTAHAAGIAAGVASERARISAILSCEAAIGREAVASKLAFTTDMSPEIAASFLADLPTAAASGLLAEMAAAQPLNLGAGASSAGPAAALSDHDKGAAEARRLLAIR